MSQSIKPDAAVTADAFGPMRQLFMAIPRLQASAVSMMLKQQKELFEFLSHRCDRDLELVDRLSHVDDVSKLPGIWSKFMQGASRDYADEARKQADAGSRSATELADQLKEMQADKPKMAA